MADRIAFRKADIILAVIFLLLGVAGEIIVLSGGKSGSYATVTVDGRIYGTYSLEEDRELRIETDSGYNVVTISDGKISVTDSDCRNHDCMNMGAIDSADNMIVCLPHRLVIEISGEKTVDSVIY